MELEHHGHPCTEPEPKCSECGCKHHMRDLYHCYNPHCQALNCHDSKRECFECHAEGCVECMEFNGDNWVCKKCKEIDDG